MGSDDARLIAGGRLSSGCIVPHMSEIACFLMLRCKELAAAQKQDKFQPE
jgi:hypothetical protein